MEHTVERLSLFLGSDEKVFNRRPVCQLSLNKIYPSGEKITPSVAQVVKNCRRVPILGEQSCNSPTYVARTASNQYFHRKVTFRLHFGLHLDHLQRANPGALYPSNPQTVSKAASRMLHRIPNDQVAGAGNSFSLHFNPEMRYACKRRRNLGFLALAPWNQIGVLNLPHSRPTFTYCRKAPRRPRHPRRDEEFPRPSTIHLSITAAIASIRHPHGHFSLDPATREQVGKNTSGQVHSSTATPDENASTKRESIWLATGQESEQQARASLRTLLCKSLSMLRLDFKATILRHLHDFKRGTKPCR